MKTLISYLPIFYLINNEKTRLNYNIFYGLYVSGRQRRKLIHTCTNPMHGFSATLTPSELEAFKSLSSYLHFVPLPTIEAPNNSHSQIPQTKPQLRHVARLVLPARTLWSAWSTPAGVWPESPDFQQGANRRRPEYQHRQQLPAGRQGGHGTHPRLRGTSSILICC